MSPRYFANNDVFFITPPKDSKPFPWRGYSITLVCFGADVNPKMPRTETKAVPEGNGPIPHDDYGSGEPIMAELYRVFKEGFYRMNKHFDIMTNKFDRHKIQRNEDKRTNQRLAGLQHQTQQPRHATETDVKTDKKTRKRTEGAAADDENHGGISSARAEDVPTSLTSFGNIAEPPAPEKCIGDALVNESAETPKPHFHSLRCACYHPPSVAYCSPAQPLQQ